MDELVNELLDNESPFFFLSGKDDHGVETSHFPSKDPRLVSTLYSGPTIEDVESSLLDMNYGIHSFQQHHEDRSEACRISELGGISKSGYVGKKKYSLRIKNHGNAITDDGYKWRKYGQKSIKNSPNPRSYYRCAKPRCNAKKRVELSMEDPDTLIVTYEGLHDLQLDDPCPFPTTNKRQRPTMFEAQNQADGEGPEIVVTGTTMDPPVEEELMGRQGLLEDIVPFVIRNPAATSSIQFFFF